MVTTSEVNIAIARKAMEALWIARTQGLSHQTGLIPPLICAMHQIGLAISDDGFVTGQKGTGRFLTARKIMFPTMN